MAKIVCLTEKPNARFLIKSCISSDDHQDPRSFHGPMTIQHGEIGYQRDLYDLSNLI